MICSLGEIFKTAMMNTFLGMGTVFCVLIFISLIISLFTFIPKIQDALAKRKETEVKETVTAPAAPVTTEEPPVVEMDDLELIAVITAAIAASSGMSEDDFVVRSIRRTSADRWNQAY